MEIYFNRNERRERAILEEGNIAGVEYKIVSYGSHPCCYLCFPKGHILYGIDYDNIDLNVHGGLTYAKEEGDMWVIGWDYNHCEDYSYWSTPELRSDGKKWTFEELKEATKEAIKELQTLKKFQVEEYYFASEKRT